MSGNTFFLDTNILAYTFDRNDERKRVIAQDLVEQALSGPGNISYQVVQEFLNLALRKFSPVMTSEQAQRYLDVVLAPLCTFYPDLYTYQRALEVQERWRYGWYDSLVITAALELNCQILYSEDLQDGQQIEGMVIRNPFG